MSNQTTKTRRFHLNPALVISCIALIFALAGSAVAAGVVGKNSVRSPQIVDGAVRTVDLHDNAVTDPKIAENAVDSPDIVENGVDASDLGTDSVGSSELQASAVRASELGPIIVVSASTAIKGNDNASAGVACPAGTTVISGGNSAGFYQVQVASSYRSGNGWHIDARNEANNDTTLTAFAYCLTGGSSN